MQSRLALTCRSASQVLALCGMNHYVWLHILEALFSGKSGRILIVPLLYMLDAQLLAFVLQLPVVFSTAPRCSGLQPRAYQLS